MVPVPTLPTLLAIAVFAHVVAGCLLLLSWLQYRNVQALSLWGLSFLTSAAAMALIVCARGIIPDFWSIVIGNAVLAASYGLLWWGARRFEGERVSIVSAFAGVAIWLVACLFPPFYSKPEARAVVMATIAIAYTLLCFRELWRGRSDGIWRWPMMILLLMHAAAIPVRIPLAMTAMHPSLHDINLLHFAIFETVFVALCGAYFLGSLARDRLLTGYKHASLTDALTGIANRRGFFDIGERMLTRTQFANPSAALIMLDLDCFKDINDRFGHAIGDQVLIAFCRLAVAQLRSNDLFGRIGGEEFAVLLPSAAPQDALGLAERIRTALESSAHPVDGHTVRVTVSVGVASYNRSTADLAGLLKAADRALCHAKAAGRNRVVTCSASVDRGFPERLPFRNQTAA
jgi:diguanylate cyclase (GGDEF)-like protein